MHRLWLALGALAGLTTVALSAFAAHGAPAQLSPGALGILRQGIEQQGLHALALLAAGLWAERRGGVLAQLAGAGFALGLVLFCGGVYAAVAGVSLGPVAPIGGVLLMAGWAALFLSALIRR